MIQSDKCRKEDTSPELQDITSRRIRVEVGMLASSLAEERSWQRKDL